MNEVVLTHKLEPCFTIEERQLIKETVAKHCTEEEFKLFLYQAARTGLDPFSRQIHAVKRWDNELKRDVMTVQTGIDGYRLIADRTGCYAGNDDAVFEGEEDKHPLEATVTVWKMVGGQRCPFTKSARWDEYAAKKKDGNLTMIWKTKPYLMLAKCAEALALRAAFPQNLSGVYTREEMGAEDVAEAEEPPRQLPRPRPAPAIPDAILHKHLADLEAEAKEGTRQLHEAYKLCGKVPGVQTAVQPFMKRLKDVAAAADAAREAERQGELAGETA